MEQQMTQDLAKEATPEPFLLISSYDLADMFRALCNAALALDAFTNRQNYGPAIQQLIYDLGHLCESRGENFDLAKLAGLFSAECDRLEADDFDADEDVEVKRGFVCLWDHAVTADQRLKYYKDRRWEVELNPVEEATSESSEDASQPTGEG
jgi:hypothetical protein